MVEGFGLNGDLPTLLKEVDFLSRELAPVLLERKEECSASGNHLDANWFDYAHGAKQVRGYCRYCNSNLQRVPTAEEITTAFDAARVNPYSEY